MGAILKDWISGCQPVVGGVREGRGVCSGGFLALGAVVSFRSRQGRQARSHAMALSLRLLRLFKWVKPDLIVIPVLQARKVYKYRVKFLHQNGPLAP